MRSFFLLLSAFCFPLSALSQTKAVVKTPSTNALTESIVVPTGKSITINSGASIVNNGTATGFGSGGTWGTITGTLSAQTDLNSALSGKQPIDAALTALSALADGEGVLTNDALGGFTYTPFGGFALPASGSIAQYGSSGSLAVGTGGLHIGGDMDGFGTLSLIDGATTLIRHHNATNSFSSSLVFPDAASITSDFTIQIPPASGTVAVSASGNITLSASGNITLTGTLPGARMPALTGDVTTTPGSVATTIATGAVGPTQLASTAVTAGSYTNTSLTVDADGRITAASNGSGGGGAIAKTGFATKTDTATTTSTTFTSVFSASFTPTSASNSVIITADFPASGTSGYTIYFKVTRGGTDIMVGDAAGSRTRAHKTIVGHSNAYGMFPVTLQVKDSPATTSPVTYQVEWCVDSGGTATFNRTLGDSNLAGYARGAASMRFDEVTP